MRRVCTCAAGTSVTVTDLNSTNGTFIEEEEIEANMPNELPLGAEIIFGAHSMRRCVPVVGARVSLTGTAFCMLTHRRLQSEQRSGSSSQFHPVELKSHN